MKTKVEVMTVADFVKITVPTGKIRQEPKPDGHVLLELKAGQELELLERQRRYSRVRYRDHFQDVTGWIANVAINLPEGNRESITDELPTCPLLRQRDLARQGYSRRRKLLDHRRPLLRRLCPQPHLHGLRLCAASR